MLDVWCGAPGRVIAVGAYGAYLKSADGGASWQESVFTPAPPRAARAVARSPRAGAARRAGAVAVGGAAATAAAGEGASGGYHLNRIVSAPDARLYIAAEAGHLYRSEDGGASWLTLGSPYEGSFFGVLPLAGETVLAFGLRGNLLRSEDAGSSWRRIDTGTVAMLDGAVRLETGAVAIVGLSGVVLVSRDGGRTFTLLQQADRAGLSAAVEAGNSMLAVVGEGGAKLISLSGAP